MKKLCVFPNDPLKSYFEKGEIKERYFNPKNIFDEVHVVSLFDEDINEEFVKTLSGQGKLKIHVTGKVNQINKKFMKKKVLKIIKEIKPDIIRSYNPLIQGWMAAQIKNELGIPLVISLHGDYDRDLRYFAKKNKDYKGIIKLKLSKMTLEKFALTNADETIIIYEFIREYAMRMGAKNITLIYNRIDLSKFSPSVKAEFNDDKPVVVCVGRLIKEKNQECLIKAVKDLDVKLFLIGNGVEYERLQKLVSTMKIDDKVIFKTSVPHERINSYYAAADIFALPIKYGGFAIPALEAAASGIPVILPKQEFDPNPELIKDFALLVENNPESFRLAIQQILSDQELKNELIMKGFEITRKINSDVMEEKEKEVYLKLLKKN